MKKYIPQKEIARTFRVTTQLVRDLVHDFKKRPEKLREKKEKEKKISQEREAIVTVIESMLKESITISKAEDVCLRVR